MPLVRIALLEGKRPACKRDIADAVRLVEVAKENWSFGNGTASYAPEETLAA